MTTDDETIKWHKVEALLLKLSAKYHRKGGPRGRIAGCAFLDAANIVKNARDKNIVEYGNLK